jgi:hypothetical protein
MSFIKINHAESLDINAIQSFVASGREMPKGLLESDGSDETVRGIHRTGKTETLLTITKSDGKHFTLCGEQAEAALAILSQHGF